MRTPIAAMLWENWRLTRFEIAARVTSSAILGAAVLVLVDLVVPGSGLGATAALLLVVFLNFPMSLVIAKLNGGTLLDGGRPGFPFPFVYTRPVRTALLVGVPMAYLGATAAASYVVPVVALGALFGYDFPLVPVASWIAAVVLVQVAAYWSTRSRVVQLAGSTAASSVCILLAFDRMHGEEIQGNDFLPSRWPEQFAYTLTDYSLIAAIGAASIALTLLGVARQRRGERLSLGPAREGTLGLPVWANDMFPLTCPSTSPWRAQCWFEMKSAGAPVLAIGVALALTIPALIGLGGFDAARPFAVMIAGLAPFVVLMQGWNAFGLRRKQGHTYASPFDATQRFSTAGLAGLKVLVCAGCVGAALGAVLASLWLSAPLLNSWSGDGAGFIQARQAVTDAITSAPVLRLAALAVVIAAAMFTAIALIASIRVVWALWPRRAKVCLLGTLLFGLAFALRAPTDGAARTVSGLLEAAFVEAFPWLVATAIPLVTILVFWRALAERLLALRLVGSAAIAWAAVVAAWLTLLNGSGVSIAALPPSLAALALSIGLLPLTVVALAPWALSRIRHR